MRRRRVAPLVLLAVSLLAGCHDDATGPDDRRIAGVDLDALFAPPSGEEIQAVLDDWAARSPVAAGIREEASIAITVGGSPGTLRVVSHLVDGQRHVGGVLAPDGASEASLPVLVYAHGGDQGTSETELRAIALAMGDLAARVVLVAPAFRSEPFDFEGGPVTAGGEPSPWDRDVDDALALIRVAARVVPAADTGRVGVLGFSRGAGVALLMGIRDPLIDRVVGFFGPTDFFGSWVRDVTEEALRGEPRNLPGLDYLDTRFIQPLKAGSLTIADVRPEIVRRSSVLFAERLPPTQIHHGVADSIVPVEQARSLIDAMDALGRRPPTFEAFLYEGGRHDPFSLPGSTARASEFLAPLLSAGVAARAP